MSAIRCVDCRVGMAEMEPASVDAIVSDPPYGIGFMGKGWDHGVPGAEFWQAALRVAKPGAHMLAFGGTRTFHRLTVAIEDAGWEIRDVIMWVYGSGFPKSLDVSKAIDSAAGAEREIVGSKAVSRDLSRNGRTGDEAISPVAVTGAMVPVTAPATEAAAEWAGWGTALKPAWEPIVVARKPLAGTVAATVLQYGTGALNIDGARIEGDQVRVRKTGGFGANFHDDNWQAPPGTPYVDSPGGRWPANLIHDGSDEVVDLFPREAGAAGQVTVRNATALGAFAGTTEAAPFYGDSGSAARFFYCAKATRDDREEGLSELPLRTAGQATDRKDGTAGLQSPRAGASRTNGARNHHPTVKPTSLMRYLVKLVTPPGGLVLDPFMGSGSTGKAAMLEGFRFAGFDIDPDYVAIARRRIAWAQAQPRQGGLQLG